MESIFDSPKCSSSHSFHASGDVGEFADLLVCGGVGGAVSGSARGGRDAPDVGGRATGCSCTAWAGIGLGPCSLAWPWTAAAAAVGPGEACRGEAPPERPPATTMRLAEVTATGWAGTAGPAGPMRQAELRLAEACKGMPAFQGAEPCRVGLAARGQTLLGLASALVGEEDVARTIRGDIVGDEDQTTGTPTWTVSTGREEEGEAPPPAPTCVKEAPGLNPPTATGTVKEAPRCPGPGECCLPREPGDEGGKELMRDCWPSGCDVWRSTPPCSAESAASDKGGDASRIRAPPPALGSSRTRAAGSVAGSMSGEKSVGPSEVPAPSAAGGCEEAWDCPTPLKVPEAWRLLMNSLRDCGPSSTALPGEDAVCAWGAVDAKAGTPP